MNWIEEAFKKIDRAQFMPTEAQKYAYIDAAASIGHGQTISQPTTVRLMLEWLGAKRADKVLDVGSGSGWTTALLSYIVGPKGQVYAVEKIPELMEFGRNNCEKAGVQNAHFFEAGDEYGLPQYEPYDRILVSASARELPKTLVEQLKPSGKLVIPVRNDILEITKMPDTIYNVLVHPGFIFVPLV